MVNLDKDNSGCMTIVLFILGVLVVGALQVFLQGMAIKLLWEWFVASYFHIKELTIPIALGLSVLVGIFKEIKIKKQEDLEENYSTLVGVSLAIPIAAIISGYIIQLFI